MTDANDDGLWRKVLNDVDGRPVPGNVEEVRQVALSASTGARAIGEVVDAFGHIAYAHNGDFEGEASRAFYDRAKDIQSQLEAAQPIFEDLAKVMCNHADRLGELKTGAAWTIKAAKLHWQEMQEAQSEAVTASEAVDGAAREHSQAVNRVEIWTAELDGLTPEDGGYWNAVQCLDDAEEDRDAAAHARSAAEQRAQEASSREQSRRNQLEWHRRGKHNRYSWKQLREGAEALDRQTEKAVRDLELGKLADPGMVKAAFNDFVDWTGDLFHDLGALIVEIGRAVITGEWDDAILHYLRDVLDKVVFVMAVVGAVVAFVGGGPIGLAIASFAIGATVLALDYYFASTKTPHPETGEVDGDDMLPWKTAATTADGFILYDDIQAEITGKAKIIGKTSGKVLGVAGAVVSGVEQFSPDASWRPPHQLADLEHFEGPEIEPFPSPDELIRGGSSDAGVLERWLQDCSEPVSAVGENRARLVAVRP